jgi:disulfide bond formation protein DsbB
MLIAPPLIGMAYAVRFTSITGIILISTMIFGIALAAHHNSQIVYHEEPGCPK